MARHTHSPIASQTREHGYQYCVSPRDCNPMAHGNIVVEEVCRCGATRTTAINQTHTETTGWTVGDAD